MMNDSGNMLKEPFVRAVVDIVDAIRRLAT
jgi:hypothetical protein